MHYRGLVLIRISYTAAMPLFRHICMTKKKLIKQRVDHEDEMLDKTRKIANNESIFRARVHCRTSLL